MCGRYTLTLTKEGIRAEIPAIGSFGMPWKPRYNIAPTQLIPSILSESPAAVSGLRWGLVPSWAKDMRIGQQLINARAETVGSKPSFRSAYRQRRCLILADGFYEWAPLGRRKQPIYIRLRSKKLFTFAGLWDIWKDPAGKEVRSAAIITTEANASVKRFHDRMPVIIPENRRALWLDTERAAPKSLADLLIPCPLSDMEMYPVSRLVNQAEQDHPELIEEVSENIPDTAER